MSGSATGRARDRLLIRMGRVVTALALGVTGVLATAAPVQAAGPAATVAFLTTSEEVNLGVRYRFEVTVTDNAGNGFAPTAFTITASGAAVVLTNPFDTLGDPCIINGQVITCTLGSGLAPTKSDAMAVQYTTAASTITAVADFPTNLDDFSDTATRTVVKTVIIAGPAGQAPAGTPHTYTVTVPQAAIIMDNVADPLHVDTALTGAAATTSDGAHATCVLSGTTSNCTDDNLDIAQLWTITLTVTPTSTGTVSTRTALSAASMLYGADTATTGITNPPFLSTGFSAPVSDPPAVNPILAGLPVPIGFGLGGDKGLTVLAAGSPASQQVGCATGIPLGIPQPATTTPDVGLIYLEATSHFPYLWRTSPAWHGSYRIFTMMLTDGTGHSAEFSFR